MKAIEEAKRGTGGPERASFERELPEAEAGRVTIGRVLLGALAS